MPRWAALALVGLAATGCGASDVAPDEAVSDAATRTVNLGSARVEMTTSFSGKEQGVARGLIRFADRHGSLVYGPFGGRHERADDTFEVRFFGDVEYHKLGGLLPPSPHPTKRWVKMTDADPDPLAVEERALRDPMTVLNFLRSTSKTVETVGTEEVRGVETTHYRGRVDFEKALEQLPPDVRETVGSTYTFSIPTDGSPAVEITNRDVPFDVWIDRDGAVRRLTTRVIGELDLSSTIEFYDYGVAVDVQRPPDDEVMTDEEWWRSVKSSLISGGECENEDDQRTSQGGHEIFFGCAELTYEVPDAPFGEGGVKGR